MRLVLALMAIVAAMACGPTTTAPPVDIPAGDATAGESLFTTNCESCHGSDAKSGLAGEDLPGAIVDDGEDEIFGIISDGKGGGEMPAFGADLSEQEIADIMAYIATL